MKEGRLFWSPAVDWRIEEGELCIEVFRYDARFAALFPEFYFLTQRGVDEAALLEAFPSLGPPILQRFVRDLVKRRVLTAGLLSVHELFYTQKGLFPNPYPPELPYSQEMLDDFKREVNSRQLYGLQDGGPGERPAPSPGCIRLADIPLPPLFEERRTTRAFSPEPVAFDAFSGLLQVFRARDDLTRRYPTDGGLCPIDVYLFVKEGGVEGCPGGFCYYNPIQNCVVLIDDTKTIPPETYCLPNREIFASSAFTIFLFYNAAANMPKYQEMGYFYGILDSGILAQTISLYCEQLGLGSCIIGDMNFNQIEPYFKLDKNQVYIHAIEIGRK